MRPVSVPGLQQQEVKQPHRVHIDPLSHREGDLRNRWQALANALFTMYFSRQRVATHGNGLRLFSRSLAPWHLPPFATGCNHGAP
jgi:hypothetical protein